MVFHLYLQFDRFWFIFGLFSIYASVRFGLRVVAVVNLYIFIISYILPYFLQREITVAQERFFDIQLGMCLLFVFSLITARIMKDVRLTREELRKQNELLEKTNQSLLQTNSELDRFVYSVSHDLSAPLKSVKGLINLSKLEPNAREIPGYLQKIEESILRLEDFIKEVLDYSRSKRAEIKFETIHLKQLVDEILQDLKYLEQFPRITLHTRLDEPVIITDRTRLKIILHNLLANAIKYHPVDDRDSPEINIISKKENGRVTISVTDNGAGMPPEIRDRVFEMFFRGSQDSSGSGLGLYIARESAEKLGAALEVESTVGLGSTFKLLLPANA
ncbi:MAG: sensor histidine kinase [Cyclobacteriaceae bacterium]|jgi:signal transduction histidine kinase